MDFSHALIGAIAAVVTAGIAALGQFFSNRRQSKTDSDNTNTIQVQTIFDGYSRIVADLHAEVQRLHKLINELHVEQEECEKRNNILEVEIENLQQRICKLEEGKNAQ